MKGLVASVVSIILVVQVLSAQGEREEGNEIQGAEDSLSNVDGTKPDEIDGWRKLRSINNVSENDLSPSKENHKKSRRTVSLPQNTEDHDSRSSLQKCNPTRTKRDIEVLEDDISLNFDASRKSKRKSAKLKLAGVCKSGKASRKLLKAIEQNSDEDSGEKISFMDDYISPPLTSNHTSTLQGHQNTNGDANSETVANNNDGLETNMAQVGPDVEMSSTRDIEPSTGNGNGDQVDQTVMNNSPSILTDEVGNSDREAAPSVGTLVELKGEPGRGQHGSSGQSAVSQSEYGPNEMSEGADFGPKTKVSENMELISTRPEESTPLQSQSPVDNSYGTPLGNDGVPSNSGTDEENNMSTGTPTSQFSVGHNLPTKQNEETNYYQDSNPTATSSFPYSTTNQQMLSNIKPPLQSQSHVANSNVTQLGTSATYDNGVPLAAGTSDGNSEYIETPTLPSDAGLPTAQNSEAYQYEDSNPTVTNIGTSSFPYSTSNQQILSSIKPPLQSQSHVDNSYGTPLDMSANHANGVSPAGVTSDANMDYIETPTLLSGAGLPTAQNSEAYHYLDSNPTASNTGTSSFPYSTTNQQMLSSIKPPLQSQLHVANSNVTQLGTSATYDNGVPLAAGTSDGNSEYIETPTLPSDAGLPTAQNSEAYQYEDSNPTVTNIGTSSFPYSTSNQQILSSIKPPLQSQSHVDNSYGTPLDMSANHANGVSPAGVTSDANMDYIETPTLLSVAGLPTAQNSEAYHYLDSNPTASNTGTSSFPYSTTNQQMLSSIKPPLQSQLHVANSNVTPLGTSATYDNGVPLAAGTSDGNSEYIETPTLPSDAGLPTAQNSEAYQYEHSNPTATNTGTSSFPYSTTNQQTLSSIKPPLQSQSHVENSNVASFGMSATYDNGVPPATGTSNGNMDYVWTPTSPLSAGLLATQNGEIYPNDKTNPTETPYSVSTPYEKQMITNIRPPLQSQSLVFNSDGGSDFSTTYNNGVSPPLGASDENIGYTGTPTSQYSAGLNSLASLNGDTSSLPFSATNQQMLSLSPSLQSQSFADNSNIAPLSMSDTYENPGTDDENSRSIETPTLQYSAGLNSLASLNGDTSSLPFSATNQQMLSLRPLLQGQSLADNSNVAPLSMSATYENPGTDDENSRSIEPPTSQNSAGLNSLTSLNGVDNNHGTPLDISATYSNGVIGAAGSKENSGYTGTPTSQFSAGLNLPTTQNGAIYSYDGSNGTPTNSEISPSFSTTDHQIRPPLQNISPVDISEGTPSGTSASYATDSERDPFSFDTGPGPLSNNSTMLLGDSPSVKDGLHRDVMLEGNQKLTPSFITSQLENNPNYTAWRESIPDSDGLSRPRCVCTCDSNQHFFI